MSAIEYVAPMREYNADKANMKGTEGAERQGKRGGLLLPGALQTAGIPFCCPVGSNRALAL